MAKRLSPLPKKIIKNEEKYKIMEHKYRMYSSLTLAYMGDAVYEIFIRTKLVSDTDKKVNNLNKLARKYVSAKAQSVIVDKIISDFTEDELAVYMRGRNTKVNTKAKNADLKEYHSATGFEALIGYLYLVKNEERLNFILEKAFNSANV